MSEEKNEFLIWNDNELVSYSGDDMVVKIPDGVKRIENTAFYGKKNITEVILPDSVKEIASLAFAGCTGLKKINIPSGVEEIGSLAFFDCVNLQPFELPSTVKTQGKMIFTRCGIPENERTMSFDSRLNLYLEAFDALELKIEKNFHAVREDEDYEAVFEPHYCEPDQDEVQYTFREFYEKFWIKRFYQYVCCCSVDSATSTFIHEFYAFIGAPEHDSFNLERQNYFWNKEDLLDVGLKFIEDRRNGNKDSIFTGFSCIDSVTHGFQPKKLYVINEDSENSSAFTFTMLQKLGMKQNIKCLLLSKKLDKTFVALNLIRSGTGIKYNKLLSKVLNDKDFKKIQEYCENQKENNDSITFEHLYKDNEIGMYFGSVHNWIYLFDREKCEKKIVFADGVNYEDFRQMKLTAEQYKVPIVVIQHGEERRSEYVDAEITFYSHEENSTADTIPYDVKVQNNELLFKGFCASGIVLNRNKGIFEAHE